MRLPSHFHKRPTLNHIGEMKRAAPELRSVCWSSRRFVRSSGLVLLPQPSQLLRVSEARRLRSELVPASATRSAPVCTYLGIKQPVVRRIPPTIAALCAANSLHMRRLQTTISA